MSVLYHFLGNIVSLIIQPLIGLLFALALYFFVFNVAIFILKSDDPKARETGRRVLIWGVVGFFVMVSVFAILALVTKTFCGVAFCKGI